MTSAVMPGPLQGCMFFIADGTEVVNGIEKGNGIQRVAGMEEVNGTKRNDAVGGTEQEVPVRLFSPSGVKRKPSVDMTRVVGTNDILMICLDTLRYDAAVQEEEAGNTPVLNQYGKWQKCQAPGNFTYRKICVFEAPMERRRLMVSLSDARNTSRRLTVIGKNVTITIRITFGSISYPNHNTKRGAMATVGTVCVSTISG